MTAKLESLCQNLTTHLGDRIKLLTTALGEVTLEVASAEYLEVMYILRDQPDLGFEQMIDLCGLDVLGYADTKRFEKRFAAVVHLLSVANNWRLRVRVFAEDDAFPMVPSIVPVWSSANWFEREAFDLYGIVFLGHDDLRRILTDYGFIGHPFRKDFPISGYVEMRYDPDQRRVIYQPVTIAPRENTPRIVREATYGDL